MQQTRSEGLVAEERMTRQPTCFGHPRPHPLNGQKSLTFGAVTATFTTAAAAAAAAAAASGEGAGGQIMNIMNAEGRTSNIGCNGSCHSSNASKSKLRSPQEVRPDAD